MHRGLRDFFSARIAPAAVASLAVMAIAAAGFRWRAPAPAPGRAAAPTGSGRQLRSSDPVPPPARRTGSDEGGASDGDPRMLHGNARRTARAKGRAPAELPTVAWARDVGGPVEAQVVSSPDGRTLYAASLSGVLTALSRSDGAIQWTLPLGERAYATPAIADDGTIYAGSDSGKLVAVEPRGSVRWSVDTDGDADTGIALAADGTAVVAAGRMVYAVSPLGWVKWRVAARRKVYTAPAIGSDGRVFFGSQDHRAYAVTAEGGSAWTTELGADVDGGPAVADDGAVFFGTDGGEVVKLDPGDGHVLWRAKLGGYVRGSLAVSRGGDVMAGVYGPRPRQVRLRAETGAVTGEFAVQGTGSREFGTHGAPVEDALGEMLFGAQDDAVYALDQGGQLLWRFPTGGDVDAPVTVLGDGSVVVGSDDGKVYLLRGR